MNTITDWLVNGLPVFIQDHWAKVLGSLLFAVGSIVFIYLRHLKEWRSRQFCGVLNVSFDVIRDGVLLTSAVLEDRLEDALSSMPYTVGIIKRAAKKTTEEDPFLYFAEKDRWHVMSQVLAVIAETNRGVWNAVGDCNTTARFVTCHFAVTYERFEEMKVGKVRVVVVPEWALEGLEEDTFTTTEYTHHIGRIHTLMKMKDDVFGGNPQFTRAIRIWVDR